MDDPNALWPWIFQTRGIKINGTKESKFYNQMNHLKQSTDKRSMVSIFYFRTVSEFL